jgi:hypothetical protein
MCRTVIGPIPHAQRGLVTCGTRLWKRNALKPILPVRSWVKSALLALSLPRYKVSIILSGSGASRNSSLPFVDPSQRCFQAAIRYSRHVEYAAERYRVPSVSPAGLCAAFFASWSAISLPLMPLWRLYNINNARFPNFHHCGVPRFTAWSKFSMNGITIDPRPVLGEPIP